MTEKPENVQYSEFELDGVIYSTLLNKKFANRKKYVRFDPKKIVAVIPGTVIKILVRKGRRVAVGDNLIMFEAMKMQTYIQTSIEGKVKQIYVKKGQMISKGYLILELE